MKKIIIQMNGWFNTRCDLMALDGEDSKERLRGTKQGWRASDSLAPKNLARVKKEVLAFSWGTNQTVLVILKWSIKSWMNCWSDLIHLKSTHIYCLELSHLLKMALLKKKIKVNMIDTLTCWRSEAMAFGLKEIKSSGSNSVFIWSWVNRYVVLLRGMWKHLGP